jgi:hypothetical protein
MRLEASTTADSIVVFGSARFVRLSHGQAGVMPGKSAFGGASAARAAMSALAMKATEVHGWAMC